GTQQFQDVRVPHARLDALVPQLQGFSAHPPHYPDGGAHDDQEHPDPQQPLRPAAHTRLLPQTSYQSTRRGGFLPRLFGRRPRPGRRPPLGSFVLLLRNALALPPPRRLTSVSDALPTTCTMVAIRGALHGGGFKRIGDHAPLPLRRCNRGADHAALP